MCMDNCIKRYENKIVLVTGAGRGIGAAIAARFAKEGAVVIVNYSGNDEAADRTVENILAANGIFMAHESPDLASSNTALADI